MVFPERLKLKKAFIYLKPVSEKEITDAQNELSLSFAPDYKEYLEKFGVASYYGHELTGICPSPRLNVVDVTKRNKNLIDNIPSDWYVIEEANIDDIILWQASSGEVFQTKQGLAAKVCDNLSEYIEI